MQALRVLDLRAARGADAGQHADRRRWTPGGWSGRPRTGCSTGSAAASAGTSGSTRRWAASSYALATFFTAIVPGIVVYIILVFVVPEEGDAHC